MSHNLLFAVLTQIQESGLPRDFVVIEKKLRERSFGYSRLLASSASSLRSPFSSVTWANSGCPTMRLIR